MNKHMKKHENNLKLDAWDFVPGKNPIGEMAAVHIPKGRISWFAHSADERLDVGLKGGSVIHLLQRNSGKDTATNEEISRSIFNIVGCAYWIDEDLDRLYEKLEAMLEDEALWDDVCEAQKKNPIDKEKIERLEKMAKKFKDFKPSK